MNTMQCLGRMSLIATAWLAVESIGNAQAAPAPSANASAGAALRALGYVEEGKADQAYLGVYPEESADGGVKLGDVVAGSPAEKAGLKAGDVIVSMNDRTIGNEVELRSAIASFGVNTKVKITFLRDGEKRRTSARLARAPGETDSESDEVEEVAAPVELAPAGGGGVSFGGSGAGYLGVQLEATDDGAKVLEVVDDSPAQKAGLQSGDVIVKVDADDIGSVEDLVKVVQAHHAGDAVKLTVERDGERMKIKATLGARSGAASGVGGMGGVTNTPPPTPPQPASPAAPRRARAPVAAPQNDAVHAEIEKLRAQVDELRRKCETQQRTIDAIRRALNGGVPEPSPSPGETPSAMALPAPESSSLFAGSFPLVTFAAPTQAADAAPATAPVAVAAPECCADPCVADATAGTQDACCAEGSVSVTTSGEGGDGLPGVFVIESGAPAQSIVITDDEGGTKVRAHRLKLGGAGGSQEVVIESLPAKVKVAKGKAAPMKVAPVKVKGVKVAPAPAQDEVRAFKVKAPKAPKAMKAQAAKSPNTTVFRAQGLNGTGHPFQGRVLRFAPAQGGGQNHPWVQVQPHAGAQGAFHPWVQVPAHGGQNDFHPWVQAQQHGASDAATCTGACAVHCKGAGLGAFTIFGHDADDDGESQVHCTGPCTIVIRGDQCEVNCEGSIEFQGAAAECEEEEECCDDDEECCEEEEACCEDEDDESTAQFELFGGMPGGAFTFEVDSDDDDEGCCGSGHCCTCDDDDEDDFEDS